MKKIFTVLIVFTLAFSITGCSKNNDKTVQEESSPVYLDASVPSAPEMTSPSPATDTDGSSLPMADWEYDLDRNGVPEMPRLVTFDEGMGQRFELWEGSKLIWSEEGYFAHMGYNALFLCVLDGEAYLLRYHPTMYQGTGTYNYQLFSLENGTETVVRENSVNFDTNFYEGKPLYGEFDPEAIAAFMDEVNDLLSYSTQLLNTDGELLDTFAGKTVAPQDTLGWLDLFDRDQSKSLPENLQAFQRARQEETRQDKTLPTAQIRDKYAAILSEFIYEYSLPDMEVLIPIGDEYNIQNNQYAITDIDCDGREELIISYTETGMAGMLEVIYDYDPDTELLKREFMDFPMLSYYDNDIIIAYASHDYSMGNGFIPFTLYEYNEKNDEYEQIGNVDTWSKETSDSYKGRPFPDGLDTDHDGVLYNIQQGNNESYEFEDYKYNLADYEEWYDSHMAGASEIEIEYKTLEQFLKNIL